MPLAGLLVAGIAAAMASNAIALVTQAQTAEARPRAVAAWLLTVAALVFAMLVVGGITRLTESGLSIVRWDPVGGIVPPLDEAAWRTVFAQYLGSPQGRLVNAQMTLAAFKGIFFWEWLHRLLGMAIGTVFAAGLVTFAALRWIPRGYGWRLTALLALGGAQGALGWWMVASGLRDVPAVAPERLAAHLGNALILMCGCLWTALDLRRTVATGERRPIAWILPFGLLLATQIVWGAFTAGLRAGHAADTWPLMLGRFVPPGLASIVHDPLSVQWAHRTLAYAVAVGAVLVAVRLWRAGAGVRAVAIGALVGIQFILGVSTVVWHVPIAVAAAHQAGAALLLAATVVAAHWCLQRRDAH